MSSHVYTSLLLTYKAIERLAEIRDELVWKGIEASWYPRDEYHLTLNYLGKVEDFKGRTLSDVREIFDRQWQRIGLASSEIDGRALRVCGLGLFLDKEGMPSVLFAKVTKSPWLMDYQQRMQNQFHLRSLVMSGSFSDKFNPHITLAMKPRGYFRIEDYHEAASFRMLVSVNRIVLHGA